jgi:N-acetylglutamate synthase-like GNAT family acetyltransferase
MVISTVGCFMSAVAELTVTLTRACAGRYVDLKLGNCTTKIVKRLRSMDVGAVFVLTQISGNLTAMEFQKFEIDVLAHLPEKPCPGVSWDLLFAGN